MKIYIDNEKVFWAIVENKGVFPFVYNTQKSKIKFLNNGKVFKLQTKAKRADINLTLQSIFTTKPQIVKTYDLLCKFKNFDFALSKLPDAFFAKYLTLSTVKKIKTPENFFNAVPAGRIVTNNTPGGK